MGCSRSRLYCKEYWLRNWLKISTIRKELNIFQVSLSYFVRQSYNIITDADMSLVSEDSATISKAPNNHSPSMFSGTMKIQHWQWAVVFRGWKLDVVVARCQVLLTMCNIRYSNWSQFQRMIELTNSANYLKSWILLDLYMSIRPIKNYKIKFWSKQFILIFLI